MPRNNNWSFKEDAQSAARQDDDAEGAEGYKMFGRAEATQSSLSSARVNTCRLNPTLVMAYAKVNLRV